MRKSRKWPKNNIQAWSDAEIAIVQASSFGEMNTKQRKAFAKSMNRSYNSVYGKFYTLKSKKPIIKKTLKATESEYQLLLSTLINKATKAVVKDNIVEFYFNN